MAEHRAKKSKVARWSSCVFTGGARRVRMATGIATTNGRRASPHHALSAATSARRSARFVETDRWVLEEACHDRAAMGEARRPSRPAALPFKAGVDLRRLERARRLAGHAAT